MNNGKNETVYFFALNMISKGVGYALLLVLANLFTVEDYGEASFVLSLFTALTVISQWGIPNAYVYYLVRRKNDLKTVSWALMVNVILLTVIGIGVSFTHQWSIPLIATLPVLLLYGISRCIFRAEHRYQLVQFTDTAFSVLVLLFTFVFSQTGREGIIFAYALAILVVSLATIYAARRQLSKIYTSFEFDAAAFKTYVWKSAMLLSVFLAIDMLGKSDAMILGFFARYDDVARYTVAYSIASMLTVIPLSISMFLLTRSAETKNRLQSRAIFDRCIRMSFTLSLLFGITLASVSTPIVRVFFRQYIGVEPLITILSAGLIFNAISLMYYTYLSGKFKPEVTLVPIFGAAIINILLDLLLIPAFGLYGICFATLTAFAFSVALFARKEIAPPKLLFIFVSPSLLAAAFLLHEWGLVLLLPAAWLVRKMDLFQRGDVDTMMHVFSQILGRFRGTKTG